MKKTKNGIITISNSNSLNQYAKVGTKNYSYDDNGNLTSDGERNYYYDCENRMYGIGGYPYWGYCYDFAGRRIKKENTRYCYDGDQIIGHYNSSGVLSRNAKTFTLPSS